MTALRLSALFLVLPAGAAQAQNEYAFDKAPIYYADTEATGTVARLDERLAAGTFKLEGAARDQVKALLSELKISESSQLLVFSKTSVQEDRISPANPRAIYFSDTCYLGWVPGGRVEVASIDAALGPVFYTFDPKNDPPRAYRFVRDSDCMRCHGTFYTERVPGVFVRSVYADDRGFLLPHAGSTTVDHTIQIESRWGGWFVTGRHGTARHLGNAFAHEDADRNPVVDREKGANINDLTRFCDTSKYFAQTSDIVALMVLEHQCAAQTALTRADFAAREAMDRQQRELAADAPNPGEPQGRTVRVFDQGVNWIIDALLFKNEAAMATGGIIGAPAFQESFAKTALRSKDGISLKDFDLEKHLFRYRCSYMIHTTSFQHLQPALKQRALARLREILAGGGGPEFDYLPKEERHQIVKILTETLPEWRKD